LSGALFPVHVIQLSPKQHKMTTMMSSCAATTLATIR